MRALEQRFDQGEAEELKAFTTAGFLGTEHGPFNIAYAEQAADTVRLGVQRLDVGGRRKRHCFELSLAT